MTRTSTVVLMTPEQQSTVDALLRRYRYICIDLVNGELAKRGIKISRSALHRHAKWLQAADKMANIG